MGFIVVLHTSNPVFKISIWTVENIGKVLKGKGVSFKLKCLEGSASFLLDGKKTIVENCMEC